MLDTAFRPPVELKVVLNPGQDNVHMNTRVTFMSSI